MSLREVIANDVARLRGELAAAEAALAAYDGKPKRDAQPTVSRKPAEQPSKRSIIAGCVTGRNRPSLDVVMARLGEAGYPTDAKARVAASNDLSKLMKARKRK